MPDTAALLRDGLAPHLPDGVKASVPEPGTLALRFGLSAHGQGAQALRWPMTDKTGRHSPDYLVWVLSVIAAEITQWSATRWPPFPHAADADGGPSESWPGPSNDVVVGYASISGWSLRIATVPPK